MSHIGNQMTSSDLFFALGQFIRFEIPDTTPAWVVAKPDASGRLVITGLLVTGTAITSDSLRRIPIKVIEARLNQDRASGIDPIRATAHLSPLARANGMSAEEFSGLVAEHYQIWAAATATPVAGLAAHWGLKSATAHSWVREARLRGLLPAARRTKAARAAEEIR